MNIKIAEIRQKQHDIDECIVLNVMEGCNMGDYIVARLGEKYGNPIRVFVDSYRFPPCRVRAGETVKLYAGIGRVEQNVATQDENGETYHPAVFSIITDRVLWSTPGARVALMRIGEEEIYNVTPL
jgi:hypothetical protein